MFVFLESRQKKKNDWRYLYGEIRSEAGAPSRLENDGNNSKREAIELIVMLKGSLKRFFHAARVETIDQSLFRC